MTPQDITPLRDPRPLYLQAEEALAYLLSASEPGTQLPPEPELAQRLGVSRATLREALRVLKDKGLIARRRGIGTFVNPRPPIIPGGLEALVSLDTLAGRLGLTVRTAQVVITERLAADEPELQDKLELAAGGQLTCVCRVKLAGDRPVAYIEDMVPVTVASVDEMRAGFQDSVLDYLQVQGDPQPDFARADIHAIPASDELAVKLKLRPGTPLLLLEEILYSTEGKPIDYSRNYFIPGYFNFHVIRRISEG